MTEPRETPLLPQPGEVVHIDFRHSSAAAGPDAHTGSSGRPLRLVQWNIERGYQLSLIIQQLRDLDADVISLQEVREGARLAPVCADLC